MENDDLPPSGRPPMASNPARPPLIRRNAQDQVPLTIEARTQAVEVLVAQASEFLQNFVTQERDRESQLQLEALEDAEVDEETIQAEHNALVAEQNQYYVQYQANRAAEAARASEGSQQFDAAAIYARVEREYAAARALPSRVERTRLEELAWSYRHLDLESMIRYMRDVQSIPRASVASSSSSARRPNTPRPDILRPDTPRPDTPHPDTRRPDTFRLVSSRIAWSTHYTKYVRFDHYYYVAPSTASRRHAVNRLVPVQEEETEEVGQRFEIIQIGTQFAENGERVLAADSENATIAETSIITSVGSSTSIAANPNAVASNDHSWYERMVDQIVEDDDDGDYYGDDCGDDKYSIDPYFGSFGSDRPS